MFSVLTSLDWQASLALWVSAILVNVQVTPTMCTNLLSYHHVCWFLNCMLVTTCVVPILFKQNDTASMISKELLIPQHHLPESILNQLKPLEKSSVFLILFVFLSLHHAVLTSIYLVLFF